MIPYKRIIFLGEAGTCRTAMAVSILKEAFAGQDIVIEARGLVVLFPEPINQKADVVLISNGYANDGFMSKEFSREDIDDDTLVLTMERAQVEKVLELYEDIPEGHIFVLTEYVGEELEIVNPYGGNLQAYGLCFEMLSHTIKKLINKLNEGE